MKKTISIIISLCIILILFPCTVVADNDDFEFTYEFFPTDVIAQGGTVHLTVNVQNLGSTTINWFDININLQDAFSAHIVTTILPGSSRSYALDIIFRDADLDANKIIQIAINNDGDANPDGVKMQSFSLGYINEPIGIECTILPDKDYYFPGDTVSITNTITNNVETHAVIGLNLTSMLTIDSHGIFYDLDYDMGNIFPLASASRPISYEIADDIIGECRVLLTTNYTIMGTDIGISQTTNSFEIKNIVFTAELSCDSIESYMGEDVNFTIALDNTGSDVHRFEVRGEEYVLISSSVGLAQGTSGEISFSGTFYEDIAKTYTVIAYIDDYSEFVETNLITLSVNPTPTATPVPTDTPSSSPTPAATAEPSSSPSASLTTETPSPAVNSASEEKAMPSQSTLSTPSATPATQEKTNTLILYAAIALLALVAIAIVILTIILFVRKKDTFNNKDFK